MTTAEFPHITKILTEPSKGVRAVCGCGFVGTLYFNTDAAMDQAIEHELQNMGDFT